MVTMSSAPMNTRHIIVLPYPGRGHINPMLSFCKSLISSSSENQNVILSIIVTEEWLSLLSPTQKPTEDTFATIPNVLPSEIVRGADHSGFLEAVSTKMEGPVELVLDSLVGPPPDVIVGDIFLPWAPEIGRRRNVKVASFCPMSASCFSVFRHHDLLVRHQHYPIDLLGKKAEERVDYILGIGSIRLIDLPESFHSYKERTLKVIIEVMSIASKTQFLIFSTLNGLEGQAINALKQIFPSTPIYAIGPAITLPQTTSPPHLTSNGHSEPSYMKWLNSQQENSVLYVSLGSYLSTTRPQLDELAAGLCESGLTFLWVAREETAYLKGLCGKKGMIIKWCDQMKVLNHKSVGGFLTHCGWNSALETAFAVVPILSFPIPGDQTLNSKVMVEDWKIGWWLKEGVEKEGVIKREEVSLLVRKFMDSSSPARKELKIRCKEFGKMLWEATNEDWSPENNVNRFLFDISGTRKLNRSSRSTVGDGMSIQ